MDYKQNILNTCKETLNDPESNCNKKDLETVIKMFESGASVYEVAIYDYLTMRLGARLKHTEAYEIPEIRQAFIDMVKDPNLESTKKFCYIDIVYCFCNALNEDILLADQELLGLVKEFSYDQAYRFFGGKISNKFFENKEIYDIYVEKAKNDPRFYGILTYNEYSLKDGVCKKVAEYDNRGLGIVNLEPNIQLEVLKQTDPKIDLTNFLSKFTNLSEEVQKYLMSEPRYIEQLILLQASTFASYGNAIIPAHYESTVIARCLPFLKELSYEQKYNFISHMSNKEMQKYLMESLNFIKNIVSHTNYNKFFLKIKDKSYIVECLCDYDILKGITSDGIMGHYLREIISTLSKEDQQRLFDNEIFHQFFYSIPRHNAIDILAGFDPDIINKVIGSTELTFGEVISLFKTTKNHQYINELIESIKEELKDPTEEKKDTVRYLIKGNVFDTVDFLDKSVLSQLTEEEFTFFLNQLIFCMSKEKVENYIETCHIEKPLNEKEQTILDNIDYKKTLTEEERSALRNKRKLIIFEKEISFIFDVIKNMPGRQIKKVPYELFNYISKEEAEILLSHLTIECLIDNVTTLPIFIDYIYKLYEIDPTLFENLHQTENNYVVYSGEELPKYALDKIRNLFFKVNVKTQEGLLKPAVLEDEKFLNTIKEIIFKDPNIYSGEVYAKALGEKLTDEELKYVLNHLQFTKLLNFFSTISFDFNHQDVKNEVLITKQEEIVKELTTVHYDYFSGIHASTILGGILKITENKEAFLKSLNINLLVTLYTINNREPETLANNTIILEIIKENPHDLTTIEEQNIKKLLSNLSQTELNSLIENMSITDLITLFANTKNKDLEETLMAKFKETPYFINESTLSIEEILSRLEESNKTIIYSKIDNQFNALQLPYDIKNKLKKSSYDEKLFLIYGVHENIFTDEKYKLINDLLAKDPFALNSLNVNLLQDDIFSISKNIIPKIYRYETLAISYINILRNNNNCSKIMLVLLEYLSKTTANSNVLIKKIDTIIKYFTYTTDPNILHYNVENITEEEISELVEYILIDSTDYILATSNFAFLNITGNKKRKESPLGLSFTEIEQNRLKSIEESMATEENIDKIKENIFKKYSKIDLDIASRLIRKYNTSLKEVLPYIEDKNLVELFNSLNEIYTNNSLESLTKYFYNNQKKYTIDDLLYMQDAFEKAYNLCIASNLKGVKNGTNKTLKVKLGEKSVEINVIELESDFDLFVHSTDAYGSMEMINDNYFDSWNYSDKTSNHGICTSYISNSNLGTAAVKGKGVMFGFTNLNESSITSLAPYDLVSKNENIITTTSRPPMYATPTALTNYTRHTHNEAVLERRNVSETSKYPVIQPDYIIIFEEMDDEIKANSIKAQKDFASLGINLPIIYMNRHKIVELEAKKVIEMIKIFKESPNLELLASIINKYESNICGLDFEKDLNAQELFKKDEIYNLIIETINLINANDDKENACKLISIIEYENSKFALVKETIGKRAHSFDLLDEKLQQELDNLKQKYLTNEESINIKLT